MVLDMRKDCEKSAFILQTKLLLIDIVKDIVKNILLSIWNTVVSCKIQNFWSEIDI